LCVSLISSLCSNLFRSCFVYSFQFVDCHLANEDTLPEYLLKEDEGNDDEDIDIDPCRLSPDQVMSVAASDDNMPLLGDLLSNLKSEGDYKRMFTTLNYFKMWFDH
jgi:hypothetical protein